MALERKNQQDWQKEQEQNLKYVGLTRSKQALYFVK
jgi:ATP-dependent exoDNAse (exonuclease V) beta subunit